MILFNQPNKNTNRSAAVKDLEKIFKALADKNRLRILKLLEKKKLCVCELAEILGIAPPSVSGHLRKLKDAGMISEEKESYWRNYFFSGSRNPYVLTLLGNLRSWLKDDGVILKDLAKLEKTDRHKVCGG
jgi:ArsR family transcriptional regulator